MKRFVFIIFLIGLLAGQACQQGASGRILFKNNMADYEGEIFHPGDEVKLAVEGREYDSIRVFLNNKKQPAAFRLTEENSRYGSNSLELVVFYDGTEKMERTGRFTLLPKGPPAKSQFGISRTYPHDKTNFTQGFHFENGLVYEGTGLKGSSKIEVYKLESGKVIRAQKMEDRYFGEGITKVGDTIFQVTYKAQEAFLYNATTLEKIGKFRYLFSKEGWGLCFDGQYLVMSNGSHVLYFVNPADFSLHHTLEVVDQYGYCENLNELDFYNGKVYANVWYKNEILVIDPGNGLVQEVIVLPEFPFTQQRDEVANGIAFKNGNLLITGKNWPFIFELTPVDNSNTTN